MNMKTKPIAILLVLFSTLLTSGGQILFKFASGKLTSFSLATFFNFHLIFGFFLYAFGAVFLVIALKYGELSILYPIYSDLSQEYISS